MTQDYPFDAKMTFHLILLISKSYQDGLDRLTQEIATGEYDTRDLTISSLFNNSAEYYHYIEISKQEQADFSAYDTSLEKIERRWRELDF